MITVLMILNCKKYAHKSQKQKDTWLKNISIPWFHIIGNPNLESDFEEDKLNKIIYVKCKDTYEALSDKTTLGIYAIFEIIPNVEYILKTDDDMEYCNFSALKILLSNIHQYDYGGEVVILTKSEESQHHYPSVEDEYKFPVILESGNLYCGGPFYFLSRRAALKVIELKDKTKHIFEDYHVGTIVMNSITDMKLLSIPRRYIFSENNDFPLQYKGRNGILYK